jgi:hypothetical protein
VPRLHRSPGNRRLLVEDAEDVRHPAFRLLVLDGYDVAPECGAASSHEIPIIGVCFFAMEGNETRAAGRDRHVTKRYSHTGYTRAAERWANAGSKV